MELIITGGVIGAAVAYLVPSLASGIGSVARPVAKEAIKGGMVAFKSVSGMVAEASEQCADLVAEAKAEVGRVKVKMTFLGDALWGDLFVLKARHTVKPRALRRENLR